MQDKGAFPLGSSYENNSNAAFLREIRLYTVHVSLLAGESDAGAYVDTELHHLEAVVDEESPYPSESASRYHVGASSASSSSSKSSFIEYSKQRVSTVPQEIRAQGDEPQGAGSMVGAQYTETVNLINRSSFYKSNITYYLIFSTTTV